MNAVLGLYRLPIYVVALFAGLLLFIPFLILVATSWTDGALLMFPPTGFSLKWYADVLQDDAWLEPFGLSLMVSAFSTVIAVVIGTIGALAIPRLGRTTARWMRTLFILPIALPPIAYGVGLYGVKEQLPFLDRTLVPLVIGEALIAVPYVFVLVSAAIGRLDPALHSAAATLGARWPLILWKVELPLLWPNVVAGAIFAANIVFDEVVLSVFLLPPGTQTLPLKMLSASQEAFSPQLTAASTIVSLLALAILGIFSRVNAQGPRAPRPRMRVSGPRKVPVS
jgi:putative spermidine/putrescine transport system permease protein